MLIKVDNGGYIVEGDVTEIVCGSINLPWCRERRDVALSLQRRAESDVSGAESWLGWF